MQLTENQTHSFGRTNRASLPSRVLQHPRPRVDGDVSRAERSDGCGGRIEAHEMHIDIAVVLEGSGDRQIGGERPTEVVDKDVDMLTLVFWASSRSTVERSKS